MSYTVSIAFRPEVDYRFSVSTEQTNGIDKDVATHWFNTEFETLGCKSRNPSGKIIMRNVVVDVAKAAGESHFAQQSEWAKQFTANCAALFGLDQVSINVADLTLTAK